MEFFKYPEKSQKILKLFKYDKKKIQSKYKKNT